MSFYNNRTTLGNTANNVTPFYFDKIYLNRKQMDNAVETDGVYIGRFVLVEYGERGTNGYVANFQIDNDQYGHSYDSTVWQKHFVNGNVRYIAVAELSVDPPTVSLDLYPAGSTDSDAPSIPTFDLTSDASYVFKVKDRWYLNDVINVTYNEGNNTITWDKSDSHDHDYGTHTGNDTLQLHLNLPILTQLTALKSETQALNTEVQTALNNLRPYTLNSNGGLIADNNGLKINAGTGLSINNNQLNVNIPGLNLSFRDGLKVNNDIVDVAVGNGLEIDNNNNKINVIPGVGLEIGFDNSVNIINGAGIDVDDEDNSINVMPADNGSIVADANGVRVEPNKIIQTTFTVDNNDIIVDNTINERLGHLKTTVNSSFYNTGGIDLNTTFKNFADYTTNGYLGAPEYPGVNDTVSLDLLVPEHNYAPEHDFCVATVTFSPGIGIIKVFCGLNYITSSGITSENWKTRWYISGSTELYIPHYNDFYKVIVCLSKDVDYQNWTIKQLSLYNSSGQIVTGQTGYLVALEGFGIDYSQRRPKYQAEQS